MPSGEQQQLRFEPVIVPQGDGSYLVRPGRPVLEPEYYTVIKAAEKLQTSEQHVRDLIDEGALGAMNVGKRKRKYWRITPAELERFKGQRSSSQLIG